MAWGRSSVPKPPPPPRSALRYVLGAVPLSKPRADPVYSKLLPLIILFVVLGAFAFVGYHLYLTFQKISDKTSEKMQSKNVVFTKDGLKVGVKEMKTENYVDKTQSFLVKAWNLSEWPEYKSRLWNQQAPINSGKETPKAESRNP
jgi:hypothetical protein